MWSAQFPPLPMPSRTSRVQVCCRFSLRARTEGAPTLPSRELNVGVEHEEGGREERYEKKRDRQAQKVPDPFAGEDLGPGDGASQDEPQRPLLPLPADLVEAEEKGHERQDDPDDVEEIGGREKGVDDVAGRLAGPDLDADDADLEGAGHGVVEAPGEDGHRGV